MEKIPRAASELTRQTKAVAEMLTCYSLLRDRFERLATLHRAGLLFVSVVLISLTFLDVQQLKGYGLPPLKTLLALRALTVALFFLTLLEYHFDWIGRARSYGYACERLANLRGHQLQKGRSPSPRVRQGLEVEYWSVIGALPRIPEGSFLKLAHRHQRKMALKRSISSNPGRPLWVHRLIFALSGFHIQPLDRPKWLLDIQGARGND